MIKLVFLFIVATSMLLVVTACGNNSGAPQTRPTYEDAENLETEQDYSNNMETVAVRFYYHCDEIDPYANLIPEAFLYDAVEIPIENLYEEFIRLMYEHTGVRILDFWFEGDKLYVDLHEDALTLFDGFGSTGGMMKSIVFENSLISLPSMTSFEVLVNGQRGVGGSHFDFGHVAIVENGEVVRREEIIPIYDDVDR